MRIAAAFLLLLGLLSGAALLAEPLQLAQITAGHALWVFFPLFSLLGYVLFAMAARKDESLLMTRAAGAALLLLAGSAAALLVLSSAGLLKLAGSLSLWYVLLVAGLLGLSAALPGAKRED